MLNDAQKSICWWEWERGSYKKMTKREHIKIVQCLTSLMSKITFSKILNHKSFSDPIFKTVLTKLKSIVVKILQYYSIFCKTQPYSTSFESTIALCKKKLSLSLSFCFSKNIMINILIGCIRKWIGWSRLYFKNG